MRIVIVGSDELHSIENFYIKYFKEMAEETVAYPVQSMFFKYYNTSILHKVLFKTGFSPILEKINKDFRKKIRSVRPDIVWVFKGMELFPETIHWMRSEKIKLVNYNPDNPFLFTGKGSGNKNVTDSIPLYDLHFTYNLQIEAELQRRYHTVTAFLPFGFETTQELFDQCAKQSEMSSVCFLGNPDYRRADFLKSLAEKGITIDVYGNNWKRFTSHKNINLYPPVYQEEFWRTLRKYRVQLNLLRIHNEQSHNMRSFEIPAIGGIQVAPDTPEHRLFFKSDEEIFLYQNEQDCCQKILHLLSLPQEAVMQIRNRARQRCLLSRYSYRDRAGQALKVMKDLWHG